MENNEPAKEEAVKKQEETGLSEEQTKIAELEDTLKRLAAEFDNYRKRVEKEKQVISETSQAKIFSELISINDVFEKALQSVSMSSDTNSKKGFEMIFTEFQNLLQRNGVRKIQAKGSKFDPTLHNAIASEASNDLEEDTILEEVQPGYTFKDAVLRHSMVVISKKA